MASLAIRERFVPHAARAGLFGVWAASIALAPSLTVKTLLIAPAVLIPLVWWTIKAEQRWITLFFVTAFLLPPFPVAIGDSGPHICLLFAGVGLLAGVWRAAEWRIDLRGPGAPLLALFAILLVSVAFAVLDSGLLPAASSLARVMLFGISVYVYFYARGGALRPDVLFGIAVLSALFACIDFYYQFPAPAGYGPQFVWLDSGVYRRAQGIFYEASTLGNFCAFFLVMVAVALALPRAQSPAPRKLLFAGGAVFLAALVLSYSRASLVCVAIALVVLAWRSRGAARFGRLLFVLPAGTVAGLLLIWRIFPVFAQTYWLRLSASAEYLFSATEGVLSGRVASWQMLTGWIAAHPWQTLVGIGYKTLPYTDYLGAPVVADNMYLSLLVETGVAGLAALIWLNVAILRAAARASRSSDPRRAFYGTWMLCFWAGETVQMASGDILTYWRILPLYFWVLALAVKA
jgi:O-Antigen ligase